MKTPVRCPYCLKTNHVDVTLPVSVYPEIVICDSESGGCDEAFAVTQSVTIESDTFKLTKVRK